MSTPSPTYNMDEIDLCKSCNTMKHLNQDGQCGRCAPEPELNVEAELEKILQPYAATEAITAILALIQQVSDQRVKDLIQTPGCIKADRVSFFREGIDNPIRNWPIMQEPVYIIPTALTEHLSHE